MSSSMVRYMDRTQARDGRKLFWGRADVDGYPFRAHKAPDFSEQEAEERVVRVPDYRNGFFDVTNVEENRLFCEVMECCTVGWFKLTFIERFWRGSTKHYLEWTEFYLEDGSRTPFVTAASLLGMEVPSGSPNFLGAP